MKKENIILEQYADVVDEVKNTLVNALMLKEKDLEKKIRNIDEDLAEILRESGRKAIEDLVGKLQEHVVKKKLMKD